MPTLPSQIYHLLRSQIIGKFRKPLIVMSPKSLLRHEAAVSPLLDLAEGRFEKLIGEIDEVIDDEVKRVIFCSGKIYYELFQRRQDLKQLYPYPKEEILLAILHYVNLKKVVWCQEEPRNQGSWWFIKSQLMETCNGLPIEYAGRDSSASPAVGYMALHLEQEHRLLTEAFEL